jgi:HK97 family phage prohead protease
MSMNIETRITSVGGPMVNADDRTLVGYGAVFGKPSQDLGGFTEIIEPDAFNRTLGHGGDVLCCVNHDPNQLLGRSMSGTMKLSVDDVGLRYEVQVPDTSVGRDALAMAERGDLFGSSFSFSVKAAGERWEQVEGRNVRYLTEVALYELGPVVSPAYLDTTVAARSMASYVDLAAAEAVAEVTETIEEATRSRTRLLDWSGQLSIR